MQKLERNWKRMELFLGLFFATFLIAAGGIWLRENREWLSHLVQTKHTASAAPHQPGMPIPSMQSAVPNWSPAMDWSKVGMNMPKIDFTPQIPQIHVPYIPPAPRIPYIPPPPRIPYIPPPPPMGFRR
jgi:hypothetical protein